MSKYNLKYSKELLEGIARECFSVAAVLRKLGLKQSGGNQSHINRRLIEYSIDTSHFTGMGHNKGKNLHTLTSMDILSVDRLQGRREKANVLRRALVEVGVPEQCDCGLKTEWNGKKLVLQVDHIDGDFSNNRKENLRFLCPNCHSQTETFGTKNYGS